MYLCPALKCRKTVQSYTKIFGHANFKYPKMLIPLIFLLFMLSLRHFTLADAFYYSFHDRVGSLWHVAMVKALHFV